MNKRDVLQFLKWPKDQQMAYLKGTGVAGLTVKWLKTAPRRLRQQKDERLRRASLPVHTNFDSLMACFDIDLETGNVCIKADRGRRPSVTKGGYLIYVFKGRSYLCHRLVMMKRLGHFIGTGLEVDHINMVKTDNGIKNLRLADPKQNKKYWQKIKSGGVE